QGDPSSLIPAETREPGQVDVPLERVVGGGFGGIYPRQIPGLASAVLDVGAGGVEGRVAWNESAGLHREVKKNPLGGPALMNRNDVAVAGQILDLALEAPEGA